MNTLKVYLGGPITGLSYGLATSWREDITERWKDHPISAWSPMLAKDYLKSESILKSGGYPYPFSTNHAIIERDHWMVLNCDILLFNFLGAKQISTGSIFELAWGYHLNKHVITIMEKNNIHQHAFVLEATDILLDSYSEAGGYIEKMAEALCKQT